MSYNWDGPFDPVGDLQKMQQEVAEDKMVDWGYLPVFYETIRAMCLINVPMPVIISEAKGISYQIAKTHAEITRKQIEDYLNGLDL